MDAKFKISPRILDHLGVAAYTSSKKCLAELCSNSYDADAENIWIEIPEEFNQDSSIVLSNSTNFFYVLFYYRNRINDMDGAGITINTPTFGHAL